jgi:hypothetical protein
MRFVKKTASILLLVISTQPSTLAQSPTATKPAAEQTPVERTRPENPILQKVTSVLDRVLEAQKTFADENLRVMIRANIADMLWAYDQPRAQRLFEDAIQAADRLADQDTRPPQVGVVSFFPVRTQVIRLILPHDPDWATRLVESRGELTADFQSRSMRRNRERTTLQLYLAMFFAQRDIPRTVLAVRPFAEIGDSRSLMQFLSLIRSKDVQVADELYLLALAKARVGQSAFSDIPTFARYVLSSFGEGVLRPFTDIGNRDPLANTSSSVALQQFLEFAYEAATRRFDAAATGTNQFRLDPRSIFDFVIPKLLAPYFDRLMPDRASAFRARLQEALQRVPPDERQYLMLSEPGTTESWLSRAEAATDSRLRDVLIQRAISFAPYEEFKRANALIERLSDEKLRVAARYTLLQNMDQRRINDAFSALNSGDLDRVEALASGISDWRSTGLLVSSLVGGLSRNDKSRAIRTLNEYMQQALDIEEPHDRALRLMQLSRAAVAIDLNRAFEEMKRAIAEFNQAGFVPELERYIDRDTANWSLQPATNIGLGSLLGNWDLDWLASTDLDRAMSLTREFQSKEAAAVMQLNVCRAALRRLSATAR